MHSCEKNIILSALMRFSNTLIFTTMLAGMVWSQEAKKQAPYVPTLVDSVSQGREIVLTKEKLLSGEDSSNKSAPGDSLSGGGSGRYKVMQGFRIQVYATTNFRDAEKKKDDLLSVIEDPVYVDYDPPYYKIRVGNFEKEDQARVLKKTLEEMGNDAWVVQSRVRVLKESESGSGKKRVR